MPKSLCWWMADSSEILAIKSFADNLTLAQFPLGNKIDEIANILKGWREGRDEAIHEDLVILGTPVSPANDMVHATTDVSLVPHHGDDLSRPEDQYEVHSAVNVQRASKRKRKEIRYEI